MRAAPTLHSFGGDARLGSERLLDRLGMLAGVAPSPLDSPTTRGAGEPKLALRLPACAPENLEPCQEGCCWRWLVHTMLEEVDGLKKSLDQAQEDLSQRSEARRKLEQVAEHNAFLKGESSQLRAAVEALRSEIPHLREEHEELLRESRQLAERRKGLLERKRRIPEELQQLAQQEDDLEAEVKLLELEVAEGKQREEATMNKIRETKDEVSNVQVSLKANTEERDKMKAEVDKYDAEREAKKKKKKPKKKSPKRSPSAKPKKKAQEEGQAEEGAGARKPN